MSRYTCMQPPAEVEPASVSTTEHFGSLSISLKMPAARAASREVNDILPMASMMGRASNEVMSVCSIGVDSSMALRLVPRGADFDFGADFLDLVLGMALLANAAGGTLGYSVP